MSDEINEKIEWPPFPKNSLFFARPAVPKGWRKEWVFYADTPEVVNRNYWRLRMIDGSLHLNVWCVYIVALTGLHEWRNIARKDRSCKTLAIEARWAKLADEFEKRVREIKKP